MLGWRKLLTVALLTTTMLCSTASATRAAPLTLLLFGAPFAASFLGGLVSLGFSTAITYGLSELVNIVFPQPDSTADNASTGTSVTYGDRVNRGAAFGTILDAGEIAYINEYNNAKQLEQVFILADGWCSGLKPTIFVNGAQQDLISVTPLTNNETQRWHVNTFDSLIEVRFHDGRPSQAVDTALISHGQTALANYENMTYVVVDCTSDKDKFSGIPSFAFVYDALLAYDIRADSTAGGSGSQRFATSSTWVYSKNPAVLAFHYLRGFYAQSKLVLGPGLSIADLDTAAFITAMNVCDEDVVQPDGVHRKRYEVNFKFDESMQYSDVLDQLCLAMGGFRTESQGRIAVYAGKAQSSVLTITDVDLVQDETRTFSPLKQGVTLYSGIEGTYTSSKDFTPLAYKSLVSSTFATANGRERIWSQDFPQVENPHQAYLLAKQQLFANQYQAIATLCLDIRNLKLTVGDWITWNSANTLRGNRVYRIASLSNDVTKMRMYLTLQEVNSAIFVDDATTLNIVVPTRSFDFAGYLTDVTSFAVHATHLDGTGGESLPALRINYDPVFDPAIKGININYRIKDIGGGVPGATLQARDNTMTDGVLYITQNIVPGVLYQAQATLDAIPGRDVNTTAWTDADVVTPAFVVSSAITVPDYAITIQKLSQDLQNIESILTAPANPATAPGALTTLLQSILSKVADQANANLNALIPNQKIINLLMARANSSMAAILEEQEVRVSSDEAFADNLIVVQATLDGNTAAIQLEQTARSTEDSALATNISQVIASLATETGDRIAAVTNEQLARATSDETLASITTVIAANLSTETTNRAAAVTSEATARATADATNASDITTVASNLSTETTNRAAAITSEATTRATADTTNATAITNALALLNTNFANAFLRFDVVATDNTTFATIAMMARVGSGGTYVESGIRIYVSIVGGVPTSQIAFLAQKIYATDGTHFNAAITFDLVTGAITATRLLSPDTKFDINLTSKYIKITT